MKFVIVCALLGLSCRMRPYQVIPRAPEYVLQSPNSHEIPLKDVLLAYNRFARGGHSIDLRPEMQIRIENAYYEKGYSRKGLSGYLGTEVARYEVKKAGLHLLTVEPMKSRPEADKPVQDLISHDQLKFRHYRLFFEILFDRKTDAHQSVLLAANNIDELANPETVCAAGSAQCTVFPEACSVSVEMSIVVNGKPQFINWGSQLSRVVNHPPQQLEMQRIYRGHLTPVKLDPHDQNQLSLPLLPGDRINVK